MLRKCNGGWVGGHIFSENHYKYVWFNVISIASGCVGIRFPEKTRYVWGFAKL